MKASNSTELATASALTVRVVQPHEVAAFDAQLADQHYLGAGRPVGDYLRQLVERDGHPVALLALLAQHHPDQPLPELLEHFHSRPNRCLYLLNS